MKKVIYSIGILSFIIVSLLISTPASAQNIGSLKSVVTPGFAFTLDLQPGYTDNQVLQLQKVLNADVDTTVALDGEGSRNKETKYFGNATKQAVIKFQEKYRDTILTPAGLTKGTGIVGKSTRTKLNLLIGVIDTYESVGSPESRGSSVTITTPAVIAPAPVAQAPAMSTCSFVELLINIQVITSANSNPARSALGCSTLATNLKPSVSLEANGKSDRLTISTPRNVTYSWSSRNVTSCQSAAGSRPLSGSTTLRVERNQTASISCSGPYGTASDSVIVTVTSPATSTATSTASQQDYSYLNNTATTTNKVLFSEGNPGDMVSIKKSAALNLKSKITLEAWVNPTAWNDVNKITKRSDSVIISKGELGSFSTFALSEDQFKVIETKTKGNLEYAVTLDKGKLGFVNNTGSLYTCDALVPLDKWSHVAVTVDETAAAVNFYVNGVQATSTCAGALGALVKTNAISEPASTVAIDTLNPGNIHLGNFYDAASCAATSAIKNGFVGKIDDVRIWNVARTAASIASTTNKSVANLTGLVAEYNFDKGNFKNAVTLSYGTDGFAKGDAVIIQDFTSPSFIGSSSASTYDPYAYMSGMTFGTSADPDGSCPLRPTPLPEEGGEILPFTGKIKEVTQCTPVNSYDGTLWQLEVKPCKLKGQDGNVLGLSPTSPGKKSMYIVIREGHQTLPAVGDVVTGRYVHDKGLACKQPIDGLEYLGTVTGALGGDEKLKSDCNKESAGDGGWSWQGMAIGALFGSPGLGIIGGALDIDLGFDLGF